jgi:hypothetical protein
MDIRILVKTIKVVLLREGIVLDRNPEQVDDLQPAKDILNANRSTIKVNKILITEKERNEQ